MSRKHPAPLRAFEMAGARVIARLERHEPGIVRRFLDEALAEGIEPSREYLDRRLATAMATLNEEMPG